MSLPSETGGAGVIRLFTPEELTREPCATPLGKAAAYVLHAAPLIGNVSTRMLLLDTGRAQFPVSVNDGGERADNSYVVSPLTAYTGYAQFEINRLGRPWLAWPLRALTTALGGMLAHAQIDRCVQVNNWLLSTNLYPPDWEGDELPRITRTLATAYPDHAIGFRSLNQVSNGPLIDRLRALGYLSIPSRQVYLFDGRAGPEAPFLKRHNMRLDAALLRKQRYQTVEAVGMEPEDFKRLETLYNLLYLDKYCPLNPQYSAAWLHRGCQDGWLELKALRRADGRLDGVLGWFSHDTLITAPIVGYDTALPQSLGLYRQITRLCLQAAADRRVMLNFSSGAAHFKRLRGGIPAIETSLVYVGHLPLARQRVWRLLSRVLHAVGVPVMRTFKL